MCRKWMFFWNIASKVQRDYDTYVLERPHFSRNMYNAGLLVPRGPPECAGSGARNNAAAPQWSAFGHWTSARQQGMKDVAGGAQVGVRKLPSFRLVVLLCWCAFTWMAV